MVIQEKPPSIVTSDPVTKDDESDESHIVAPINYLGIPNLSIGV